MCSAYANDSLLIRANTSDVVPSAVAQLSATVFALSTSYDLYNIQPGDLLAVSSFCTLVHARILSQHAVG